MQTIKLISIGLFIFSLIGCKKMDKHELPDYIAINNESADQKLKDNLKIPAQTFNFPLSEEDINIINTVEAKFDQEENMAGLAAPQIGLHKQVIVFSAPDDPQLKKWRPELTQTMDKTIWLNPSYEIFGDETTTDYEACFSVDNLVGPVERATNIKYTAFDKEGNKITGEATGFLARVIQHEVDHVHGILFIEKVPENQIESIESYREKRAKAMAEEVKE